EVVPAVNQVECHPYLQQKELKAFCQKHDIYLEAWSPLMSGGDVLSNDIVREIAEKHGKTIAQVGLRWHLPSHSIVIPKSVTPSRIEEYFDVFDLELSADDMDKIAELDRNHRYGRGPSQMTHRYLL